MLRWILIAARRRGRFAVRSSVVRSAIALAVLPMLIAGCADPGGGSEAGRPAGGASSQVQRPPTRAGGAFTLTGRHSAYYPAGELAECKDGRSVDVFEEARSGGAGQLLASSPLVARSYDSASQSCVYEWTLTLPLLGGRYGICLEYPTARGVIPPSLWMSKEQIDNYIAQAGGIFQLSL